MAQIYLLIDGQQQGPYTEQQVKESLAEGLIPSELPAWREGLADWVQVGGLVTSQGRNEVPKPEAGPSIPSKSSSPTMAKAAGEPAKSGNVGRNLWNQIAPFFRFKWVRIALGIAVVLIGLQLYFGSGEVFVVREAATEPDGAWLGVLKHSDGTSANVIVVLGTGVTIAEDDRITGTFVPTSETGICEGGSYRIYRVKGNYSFVHPAQ